MKSYRICSKYILTETPEANNPYLLTLENKSDVNQPDITLLYMLLFFSKSYISTKPDWLLT